jgi:hypothetical protein
VLPQGAAVTAFSGLLLRPGAPPAGATLPACPWCKTAILDNACVALPSEPLPSFFDAAAVHPDARAAAMAAAAAAPPAAAAWRAAALAEAGLIAGMEALRSLEWPHVQAAARRALRAVVVSARSAAASGPRQTEEALRALRSVVVALRAGGRSLTALVETRRVCHALEAVSDAMLAHTADAGVQLAGVAALCATGVWAARRPQRALAAALGAHAGNAAAVALLAPAAARFTRSRLSSHAGARVMGTNLAAVLMTHAADAVVAPAVVDALRNTLVHLTPAERCDVGARGATRNALQVARAAAETRGDAACVAAATVAEAALEEAFMLAAIEATTIHTDGGAHAGPAAAEAHVQGGVASPRCLARTRAQRAAQRGGGAASGLATGAVGAAADDDDGDEADSGARRPTKRARTAAV